LTLRISFPCCREVAGECFEQQDFVPVMGRMLWVTSQKKFSMVVAVLPGRHSPIGLRPRQSFMRIRIANALEIFAVKNTATFRACREQVSRPKDFSSWLSSLSPRKKRFRLVAELEGNALGYLTGALANAHGLLEEFLICTNEGMAEVSHALMEIFEVHCLQRNCQSVFVPGWMDEMLITARGFTRSGTLYVKLLRKM
jgi:hypothetical protein